MVIHGRVQNGVVTLAPGVFLPEGQEVTVLAPDPGPARASGIQPHSLLDLPPLQLGSVLPEPNGGDLLGEMLEGRR